MMIWWQQGNCKKSGKKYMGNRKLNQRVIRKIMDGQTDEVSYTSDDWSGTIKTEMMRIQYNEK